MLLKPGVYRHLLYNRGTEPRQMVPVRTTSAGLGQTKRSYVVSEHRRWGLILRLGIPLILFDAFIRQAYLKNPNDSPDLASWSDETIKTFIRVFVGCFAVAFHGGIMISCHFILNLLDHIEKWTAFIPPKSDIRKEFRLSLIPLSLFYSSLIKLFLLCLLTIWVPTSSDQIQLWRNPLHDHWHWSRYPVLRVILAVLDDDKNGREWIVRNILGGMSAGFGLRVILDIYPVFTIAIIIAGWMAKTTVAGLVSEWVGGDAATSAAWLAYSTT